MVGSQGGVVAPTHLLHAASSRTAQNTKSAGIEFACEGCSYELYSTAALKPLFTDSLLGQCACSYRVSNVAID